MATITNPRESDCCHFGRFSYGNPVVKVWKDGGRLRVGNFCSIGPGVVILLGGGNHQYDTVSTFPFDDFFPEYHGVEDRFGKRGVVIGSDVWIGMEAMILPGIKIGDGAVIGARSVVTKDVPPYAVVAGNPARLIKFRFPEDVVDRLLEIGWWDWPLDKIMENIELIMSRDVFRFIDKFSVY